MDTEKLALAGYEFLRFLSLGVAVGYGIAMLEGFYKDKKNVRNRDVVLVACVCLVLVATLLSFVTDACVGIYGFYSASFILVLFHILMWSVPATRKWGRRKVVETKDDVV